jgi:DNA-binding MarR family transcriptional regulator
MGSLEQAIQQNKFESEQVKAFINVVYTANILANRQAAVLKPFNLTQEQFNVLRILRGSIPKSMCQKDILCRMVAPSSNVTLLIKKLLSKKLVHVTQSDIDRREYVINITKSGLNTLKTIDIVLKKEQEEFNPLSETEANQLNKLLDKMRS